MGGDAGNVRGVRFLDRERVGANGNGMGMGQAPDFYSRQAEASPESKFFAENQTAFALKLYRGATEDAKTDANVLVAPFSVFRGLNALSLGSAGETKAEIDAALGRSDVADETWIRTLAAVDSSLNAAPETTFAGALWFAPDLELDETFVQRCKETSRIEAAAFDFAAPNALKRRTLGSRETPVAKSITF